jgi:hypothetical protein
MASDLASKTTVSESVTRLGYKIHEGKPLPREFDPLSATNKQLADHMLPRRPDAQTEPRLRKLWEDIMGKTTTWIVPNFDVKYRERRIHPRPPRAAIEPHVASGLTSQNWSGALIDAKHYGFVTAQWTVSDPNTTNYDVNDGKEWKVSTWVGIDGWFSSDLLQAGTAAVVSNFTQIPHAVVTTYAWWEWYPNYEMAISNFPVSTGDVVFCMICADDSLIGATIYLSNLSTGIGTRFHITPPHGTKLVGDTAEWVVERPATGEVGHWHLDMLPDYVTYYFDQCLAGGSAGLQDLEYAQPITMTSDGSANGAVLSAPTIENDGLLRTSWFKSD